MVSLSQLLLARLLLTKLQPTQTQLLSLIAPLAAVQQAAVPLKVALLKVAVQLLAVPLKAAVQLVAAPLKAAAPRRVKLPKLHAFA